MPQISTETTFKGAGPNLTPMQVHNLRGDFPVVPVGDYLVSAANAGYGATDGTYSVQIEGANTDIDIASGYEDLWDGGGTLTFPTSAENLERVSSSANDDNTPPNTGALKINYEYLDSNYDFQTETASAMNGVIAMSMAQPCLRFLRAWITSVGSNGTNVGNLTIRVAGGGATRGIILAGQGETRHGTYTIPSGKTGYLTGWWFGIVNAITAAVTCEILTNTNGEGWRLRARAGRAHATAGSIMPIHMKHDAYIVLPEKTDIKIRAATSVDNTHVVGGFDLIVTTN